MVWYPALLRPMLQFLLVLSLWSSDLVLATSGGNAVDFNDVTVDAFVTLDDRDKFK